MKILCALVTLVVTVVAQDECGGCLNNGYCNFGACICPAGFSGSNCQTDECQDYCQNRGACFPTNDGLFCICPEGYTGDRCEEGPGYVPCADNCPRGRICVTVYPACKGKHDVGSNIPESACLPEGCEDCANADRECTRKGQRYHCPNDPTGCDN